MKDNLIDQTAFDWLTRVDAGLTTDEDVDFATWLHADQRHYGAYMRAKAVSIHADRIKAFAHSPDPDDWKDYIDQGKNDFAQLAVVERSDDSPRENLSRRRFLGGLGVATFAGLTAGYFLTSQPAEALTIQTGLGERKELRLADGSIVALNTDSKLRILFNQHSRTVELVRGEVLYDVVPDQHRPFIVKARGFEIRTSEASFVVQQLPATQSQLIVEKGVLDLTPANSTKLEVAAPTKIQFMAGNHLSGTILTQDAMARELLWREGKVAFDDTPLAGAIATFERYGTVQFNVENRQLLNQTVSGVFSSDDPIGFAEVVAEIFDLEVSRADGKIALRSKR